MAQETSPRTTPQPKPAVHNGRGTPVVRTAPAPRVKRGWGAGLLAWLVVILVLLGAGYYYFYELPKSGQATASAGGAAGAGACGSAGVCASSGIATNKANASLI